MNIQLMGGPYNGEKHEVEEGIQSFRIPTRPLGKLEYKGEDEDNLPVQLGEYHYKKTFMFTKDGCSIFQLV